MMVAAYAEYAPPDPPPMWHANVDERMGFVRMPERDFFPIPEFRVMAYRLPLA